MNMQEAREAMVDNQIRPADVTDYHILEAFLQTKRESFLPESRKQQAYGEYEVLIGDNRAMMTPRSFAKLLQMANPQSHEDILVIGAGVGYEAAVLSRLVRTVIAVETQASLVRAAEDILANEGYDNAVTVKGALTKGMANSAPYDLIVFNGSIQQVPSKISDQLKENGRIAAIFEDDGVFTGKMLYLSANRLFERSFFQASAPSLPGFERKIEFVF